MSSWCLHTAQMFTLVKLKNNTNITSTPEQPHRFLNPPYPQSTTICRGHTSKATLNLFLQLIPPTSGEDLLSTDSTTGGMMGVVGRAERHREACPQGRGSGITWLRSRSSVSVPAGWMWMHGSAVRNLMAQWALAQCSALYSQSCKRPWTGFPDVQTLPQGRPVFLLSPEDFPWCCATER